MLSFVAMSTLERVLLSDIYYTVLEKLTRILCISKFRIFF